MTAESTKPRMSGQRISHPMAKAMPSACKTAVNMMNYSTSFRPCNRPKRNQFRKYALAATEAAALTVKRYDTAMVAISTGVGQVADEWFRTILGFVRLLARPRRIDGGVMTAILVDKTCTPAAAPSRL